MKQTQQGPPELQLYCERVREALKELSIKESPRIRRERLVIKMDAAKASLQLSEDRIDFIHRAVFGCGEWNRIYESTGQSIQGFCLLLYSPQNLKDEARKITGYSEV